MTSKPNNPDTSGVSLSSSSASTTRTNNPTNPTSPSNPSNSVSQAVVVNAVHTDTVQDSKTDTDCQKEKAEVKEQASVSVMELRVPVENDPDNPFLCAGCYPLQQVALIARSPKVITPLTLITL